MTRIRFLSQQIFDTGAPGKGPTFPEGAVLDSAEVADALGLNEVTPEYAEGFLRRWLNRGVAEEVDQRTPTSMERAEDADTEEMESQAYDTLTRAQLDALAEGRGIDISTAKNKADVVAALKAADEADDQSAS
jgi:uncharacterized protein with von Willebrand factor type A (vWA) domain